MKRRGFMSQAEALSLEQRAEMRLAPVDPLDPFELAALLEIPVLSFDACGAAIGLDSQAQSAIDALKDRVYALTACFGRRRVIIYNDGNARTRQVSDVAHELSHTLLEHGPTSLEHPERYLERDSEIEDEANYLAGALLAPREGVLALMRSGMSDEDLAGHYGVSLRMARWRSGATGVKVQVERERRARRS
jgi:Zn-dependent peptidase ImmA (M78 family)